MNSAVCTLFEGSYHYGLAALTNSLHKAGFRGDVYAGYRGARPAWAGEAPVLDLPPWTGASAMQVADGLRIVFLPLRTGHHLTNYKPDFMLALLDGPARGTDALYYLDPDICVAGTWRYFEDWVGCGVALCEDLNSPLPEHHPRRVGWRRYYAAHGLPLRFRAAEYVNGGFVGVSAVDRPFIETWKRTMDLMAAEIGSLAVAKIATGQAYRSTGFAGCFDCSDQDALNAAVEASDMEISVIGQEAMAFKPGTWLLPHGVGPAKPWQRRYLHAALGGVAPRGADKAFWSHVTHPIAPYRRLERAVRQFDLRAAAAVGRLLRKA
jgi:hypothetical protein